MKIIEKVIIEILTCILLLVIFVSTIILTDSLIHKDKIPSFFGWKPFIVLSGSIENEIKTGDMVFVKETNPNDLNENDIMAFKTNNNTVIIHKIAKKIVTKDGEIHFLTKDEKNNVDNQNYVLENQIEGIYKFRIAKLGKIAIELQKPVYMVIAISIPLVYLAILQYIELKNKEKLKKQRKERTKQMEEELERLRKKEKNQKV